MVLLCKNFIALYWSYCDLLHCIVAYLLCTRWTIKTRQSISL